MQGFINYFLNLKNPRDFNFNMPITINGATTYIPSNTYNQA